MLLFFTTGLIEPAKEIVKVEKKRAQLLISIEKLKKTMSMEGYEAKVPTEVREKEREKLENSKVEVIRLDDAIKALKAM